MAHNLSLHFWTNWNFLYFCLSALKCILRWVHRKSIPIFLGYNINNARIFCRHRSIHHLYWECICQYRIRLKIVFEKFSWMNIFFQFLEIYRCILNLFLTEKIWWKSICFPFINQRKFTNLIDSVVCFEWSRVIFYFDFIHSHL